MQSYPSGGGRDGGRGSRDQFILCHHVGLGWEEALEALRGLSGGGQGRGRAGEGGHMMTRGCQALCPSRMGTGAGQG